MRLKSLLAGDPACQSIVGTEIEAAVGKLLVEAVTPMALELALDRPAGDHGPP